MCWSMVVELLKSKNKEAARSSTHVSTYGASMMPRRALGCFHAGSFQTNAQVAPPHDITRHPSIMLSLAPRNRAEAATFVIDGQLPTTTLNAGLTNKGG